MANQIIPEGGMPSKSLSAPTSAPVGLPPLPGQVSAGVAPPGAILPPTALPGMPDNGLLPPLGGAGGLPPLPSGEPIKPSGKTPSQVLESGLTPINPDDYVQKLSSIDKDFVSQASDIIAGFRSQYDSNMDQIQKYGSAVAKQYEGILDQMKNLNDLPFNTQAPDFNATEGQMKLRDEMNKVLGTQKIQDDEWFHGMREYWRNNDFSFSSFRDAWNSGSQQQLTKAINSIRDFNTQNQSSFFGQRGYDYANNGVPNYVTAVTYSYANTMNALFGISQTLKQDVQGEKIDPNFNSSKHIEKLYKENGESPLQGFDEYTVKRLMSSRSEAEFNREYDFGQQVNADRKQNEKVMLGDLSSGLGGFFNDPVGIAATIGTGGVARIGTGALALRAGLSARAAGAVGFTADLSASSVAYGMWQQSLGNPYDERQFMIDMFTGAALSLAVKGALNTGKLARKLNEITDGMRKSDQDALDAATTRILNEDPTVTPEQAQARAVDELRSQPHDVDNTVRARTATFDETKWPAKDIEEYGRFMKEVGDSAKNDRLNAERKVAREAMSEQKIVDNISNEKVAGTVGVLDDGQLRFDGTSLPKSTPPSVIKQITDAVENANKSGSISHLQAAGKGVADLNNIENIVSPSLLKSTFTNRNKLVQADITQRTGGAVNNISVKWSKPWQDFVFNKAYKEGQTGTSKTSGYFDQYANEYGFDSKLFTALNKEMTGRIDNVVKGLTKENVSEFGLVTRTSKGANKVTVDFNKVWPEKDIKKFIGDFYKNSDGTVKKSPREIFEETYNGNALEEGNIRISARPNDAAPDDAIVLERPQAEPDVKNQGPKHLRDLDPSKDLPVLTDVEIFKKYGLEKYIDYPAEQAFKLNKIENQLREMAEQASKNSNTDRVIRHSKVVERIMGETAGGKATSMTASLLASDNAVVRGVGLIWESPLGATSTRSAALTKHGLLSVGTRKLSGAEELAFEGYVNTKFANQYLKRAFKDASYDYREQFQSDFFYYFSSTPEQQLAHPMHSHFKDLAKEVNASYAFDWRLQRDYQLDGHEVLPDAPKDGHFTYRLSAKKLEGLNPQQLSDYVKGMSDSIIITAREGGVEFTPRQAEAMSKMLVNKVSSYVAEGKPIPLDNSSSGMYHLLEEAFNSYGMNLSDLEKIDLIDKFKRTLEMGKFRRIRRNPHDVISSAGGDFKVGDLMEHDLTSLARQKIDETAGKVALIDQAGIRNTKDIDAVMNVMRANKATAENISNAEYMFKETIGGSYNNNGSGNRFAQLMKAMMYPFFLPKAGFAQLMEFGNVAMSFSIKDAVITAIKTPFKASELKQFARTGKTKNQILKKNNESGFGYAEDSYGERGAFVNQDRVLVDTRLTHNDITLASKLLGWGEVVVNKLNKLTSVLSGMRMLLAGQRQGVMELSINTAYRHYKAGTLMNNIELVNAGFNDGFMKRLDDAGAFKVNSRGNVLDINMDVDGAAGIDLMQSARRMTDQVIQTPNLGEQGRWQRNPMYSLLSTLRTYPILAMHKQLGRSVSTRGIVKNLMYLMGWGMYNSVVVAGRTMFTAAVMDDDQKAEEYLEKNLNPLKLFANGLSYVGTVGLGADLFNTVMGIINNDYSAYDPKSQGFASQLFPVISGVQMPFQAAAAISEKIRAEEGDDVSLQPVRRALPIVNTPPAAILLKGISDVFGKDDGSNGKYLE